MCKHQIENKLKRDEDRNRDQPFQSGLCQHNKYSINTSPSLSHSLCDAEVSKNVSKKMNAVLILT